VDHDAAAFPALAALHEPTERTLAMRLGTRDVLLDDDFPKLHILERSPCPYLVLLQR
jgi:hypothetical protein